MTSTLFRFDTSPIYQWDQLPQHVQNHLQRANFDGLYRDAHNDELRRRSILNNYVKLQASDLWSYVRQPAPDQPPVGSLQFLTNDVNGFINSLNERRDFTNPSLRDYYRTRGESPFSGTTLFIEKPIHRLDNFWESREDLDTGQLHIKHFINWPQNQLQTHIDPTGYRNITDGFGHMMDYSGYQDPVRVSSQLQNMGYGLLLNR